MINRQRLKIIVSVFLVLMAIIACFMIFNDIKDKHIKEAIESRVAKEMELKQAKKEYEAREIVLDSLKGELEKTLAVIEYQKKYPQIIVKKYEIQHNSVDSMSSSESYKLLTNNIGEYRINKKRYSVSRFK